jgi:hypothetical protein
MLSVLIQFVDERYCVPLRRILYFRFIIQSIFSKYISPTPAPTSADTTSDISLLCSGSIMFSPSRFSSTSFSDGYLIGYVVKPTK